MKKLHSISYYLLTVICYSAILLSASSCRPKGILSSQQMEDILVDLHTAEGMLQEAGYNYGHDEDVRGYYLAVLKQHKTTQAQFDTSLVWYTANPTIFDKIYPKVIERLEAQANAYQAWMDATDNNCTKSSEQWEEEMQYGLKWLYWQKKYEKKRTKFVYVEKLL